MYNIKITTCVHMINCFNIIITCNGRLKMYIIILNGRRVLKFFIGDEYTYANQDYKWIPLSVRIFQWHSNNEGDSTIEKCSRYIYILKLNVPLIYLKCHIYVLSNNNLFLCQTFVHICIIILYTYIIVIIIITLKTLNESFDSPSSLALN